MANGKPHKRASESHSRDLNFCGAGTNHRNLRVPQSRGFERPRRSRSQHWNPRGVRCLSSASVAQIIAAASIKVRDALFGFLARNDAECCKRELLGRSWRRDWAMRTFRAFCPIGQNLPGEQFFCGLDAVGTRQPTHMHQPNSHQPANDTDENIEAQSEPKSKTMGPKRNPIGKQRRAVI